jgi:outer membrane receptor protein involved in Fe transport
MKNYQNLLVIVLFFISATVFSQTKVEGTVVDETGGLPGANVMEKGTTIGTVTDFDGKFSLDVKEGSGTLVISFVGMVSKNFPYTAVKGQTINVGEIVLTQDNVLDEVVLIQTSFAVDRKTPVAVSTVTAGIIEHKLGTQEFPEILKSTPGVYATKSGGGFGDGRLSLRGFNSENVAVMINGVPVNDMENGRVYWSNWAGLSDVTSAMQVQRGLGASKLAVPSIGGTVNILSKTTDVEQGGNVFFGIGNDGYQKIGATVSTGLLDNGWAVTTSMSKTTGNGYVDGTEFEGYNYFLNISKQINENHKIALTTFGAPQTHGQRQNRSSIEKYKNAKSGIRYNPDWGLRDGNVVHIEDNFYHKNQTSLNHYWTINEDTNLSTALYGSWGNGGGGGTGGDSALFQQTIGNEDQPKDIDNIVAINRANGEQGLQADAYLRASRNDHEWYGLLSTFKTEFTDNLVFIAGVDLRTYTGIHFSELTDLLGGAYVIDDNDVNNPNRAITEGDKRDYYNDGNVGWQGLFTQVEYNVGDLATFISAAVSNTSYQRVDYFNYLDSDPLQETDKYNFVGFSVKGGANYNLSAHHNVFANIGYFEKAAGFDDVFLNFDNEHINEDAKNQKIFSAELGYGFRTEKLTANVNLYYTQWNDRSFTDNFNEDGVDYFVNLLGVDATHQGIEIDFVYRPLTKLSVTGMLSLGDWEWDSNVLGAQVYDDANNPIGDPIDLYIKGLKVADAAQTTAAIGLDYEVMPKMNFTIDYNYFGNLYADFDPNDRTIENDGQAWKAPDYNTFDTTVRYSFDFGPFDTTLIGGVYNIFNTEYISDALDGSGHDAASALVWFGYGRTFSLSAKIRF